jgi:RNA polymerase sigma-70 factor (ECF subfamily)
VLAGPIRLMGFVRTVLHRQLNAAISQIVGARENYSPSNSTSLLSDSDLDPEQQLLVKEKLEAMKRRMQELSEKDVEILTRFYLRGQEPERICNEMALTMTQFTLRKSRAKGKLVFLIRRADQKHGMQG